MQPSSYCKKAAAARKVHATLEWKACLIRKIFSHPSRSSVPVDYELYSLLLRNTGATSLTDMTMYGHRGEPADFAHQSPHHHLHECYILIVSGGNKYQFRLSAIQSQLPGLFKAIRRDRGHRKKDKKRQFDVVDVINSRFNPSRDVSYIIECAQTILDHVHQDDTGAVPTALTRCLDSYLGRHGTHDGRVHDWKALVRRFAVLGKLLAPSVLGCSRELFDVFSGWFIRHSHTIVRSMPIDAVLDFIHAFERTRRPFPEALHSMILHIGPWGEDELLSFESKPTYLRSFISTRTIHRIRKIIYANIDGLRTKDRRRLPDPRDWSPGALVRPGLPSPGHSGRGSRDLVPRVHGAELVSGNDFGRGMLHDIVDFEPERILVQEPYVRPHHGSGRFRTRHGRANPVAGRPFMALDHDDFSYTDSETDDDDYLPSPYEYDDAGVGGRVVPPCLMSPFPEPEGFGGGRLDMFDDMVHAPHPVPIMV